MILILLYQINKNLTNQNKQKNAKVQIWRNEMTFCMHFPWNNYFPVLALHKGLQEIGILATLTAIWRNNQFCLQKTLGCSKYSCRVYTEPGCHGVYLFKYREQVTTTGWKVVSALYKSWEKKKWPSKIMQLNQSADLNISPICEPPTVLLF